MEQVEQYAERSDFTVRRKSMWFNDDKQVDVGNSGLPTQQPPANPWDQPAKTIAEMLEEAAKKEPNNKRGW